MGGLLLNTLACALLYQPVDKHLRLVVVEEVEKNIDSEKEPSADALSSHRSSIVSAVGPVTLDPRRDPRQLSLSRQIVKQKYAVSAVIFLNFKALF